MQTIFSKEDLQKANIIMSNKHCKLSDLISAEIKSLAVVWCYYSGKIEGNTYSFVETEALLTDGITSEKKYEDAKMLKNLYNTFIGVLNTTKQSTIKIDEFMIKQIHSSLTADLLPDKYRGVLRTIPVVINGTNYIPPKDEFEVKNEFEHIIREQEQYVNPLERAVFIHCNMARLQPFRDGNKRTSRILESVVLMNNNLIPVYSAQEADILHYKKALKEFYETRNYKPYVDYFLDRQITRIKEVSTTKEIAELSQILTKKEKDFGVSI